jgi:hypothetical protein
MDRKDWYLMKIVVSENDVFEFHLDTHLYNKVVICAKSFEEAKKRYLQCIEDGIDQELQRMFIEFNKKYYTNLGKEDI